MSAICYHAGIGTSSRPADECLKSANTPWAAACKPENGGATGSRWQRKEIVEREFPAAREAVIKIHINNGGRAKFKGPTRPDSRR
jgi:hypothetical protein